MTSAGSGPSVGKHLLMSYLPPDVAKVGTPLLVEYLGEQYPVTVRRRRLDARCSIPTTRGSGSRDGRSA